MRGDHWPTSIVALAASVLLVLGAGVVSATAVERRPAPDDGRARAAGDNIGEVARAGTTSTSDLGSVGSTTSPPVAGAPAKTGAGSTASTSRPSSSPTTVTTRPLLPPRNDRLDPALPPVDRRFQPGRTTWSTSGAGWSITVRVDNPAPTVGQPVRFDFEVTSAADPCCGVSAWFDSAPTYTARSGGPCPMKEPRPPGTAHFHTTVAFERPGWQGVRVTANTGGCGLDPPRATLIGDIEVKARSLNVQGPRPPEVLISTSGGPGEAGHRSQLMLAATLQDPDGGRIRSVTINWGDGSPLSRPSQPLPPACTVEPDGSTHSEEMLFSGLLHEFATAGSYVVTVTAVSTACDGVSMAQTSSEQITWSTESGLGTRFG